MLTAKARRHKLSKIRRPCVVKRLYYCEYFDVETNQLSESYFHLRCECGYEWNQPAFNPRNTMSCMRAECPHTPPPAKPKLPVGRPATGQKSATTVTGHLPSEYKRLLDEYAIDNHMSITQVVNEFLKAQMKEEGMI